MKNKFRSSKAITLIALVITIIVLLILAGVTIATLTGENGLLNRAKTAKEATGNSQIQENVTLADYETKANEYMVTNRDEVTLNDDEYAMLKSFFSKNIDTNKVSIMKPNTWEVGTEYDFGDDVYGERFTGNITKTGQHSGYGIIYEETELDSNASKYNTIITTNGYFYDGSEKTVIGGITTYAVDKTHQGTVSGIHICEGKLYLTTGTLSDRTNAPYDVWMLYTKNMN